MALQIPTYRFVTLYIIYSLKILLCEISYTLISKSYKTCTSINTDICLNCNPYIRFALSSVKYVFVIVFF